MKQVDGEKVEKTCMDIYKVLDKNKLSGNDAVCVLTIVLNVINRALIVDELENKK